MLVLPCAIAGLILLHLYLVVRLGVSNPPWGKELEDYEDDEPSPARQGLVRRRPAGTAVNELAGRAPAPFKAYKEDVERRGKSFFPHAMFHDTVMSLVVVSVIIGLAHLVLPPRTWATARSRASSAPSTRRRPIRRR